jgi:hypothetical protein
MQYHNLDDQNERALRSGGGVNMVQQAYRVDTSVGPEGKLELTVPLAPGTLVQIVVFPPEVDEWADLTEAAGSSAAFWDNPLDDEHF